MFEEPIKNIQQAKEYFRAMGCSHFHMSRDDEQRYNEYKALNISRQMEAEWRQEQFDEYYASVMEYSDESLLWTHHSRMYDLYESIKTDTALIKLLEITRYIRDIVPSKDRVIVAETINGRTVREARTGLIYRAYDSGNIETAKEFARLSLHFSSYTEGKSRGKERCQKSTGLCKDIMRELDLK